MLGLCDETGGRYEIGPGWTDLSKIRATPRTWLCAWQRVVNRISAIGLAMLVVFGVCGECKAQGNGGGGETIAGSCAQLWQVAGAGEFVIGESAIVLPGIEGGTAYFTRVQNGVLIAAIPVEMEISEVVKLQGMDLDSVAVGNEFSQLTEMEVHSTIVISGGLTVPVELWVWQLETALGQLTIAFARPTRLQMPEPVLLATSGACEAACKATQAAADALALANYNLALANVANTLKTCLMGTAGGCAGVGGVTVLLCPPCAPVTFGACIAAALLICADSADTSRTAALAVYEAALNVSAIAAGNCINACRAAGGGAGGGPAATGTTNPSPSASQSQGPGPLLLE